MFGFSREKLLEGLRAGLLAFLGVFFAIPVSTVAFRGCAKIDPPGQRPPDSQPDTPEADPTPPSEPIRAIGRVVMSGGYCSGTVIGPPRPDGIVKIVSAAHCFTRVNEKVTFHTLHEPNVRSFQCTVISIDRTSDAAILISDVPQSGLTWVPLATETPPAGTDIWHAGFGRHIPGNVEKGRVLAKPNAKGQTQYWLSVSPGDSGGGIMFNSKGELLSPVCCTTRLDGPGNVWGAAPEVLVKMVLQPANFVDDLKPAEMPAPPLEEAVRPIP
jgi:hypothetical protein